MWRVGTPKLRDTTSQGDITETQVAAALVLRGLKVLRPLSSATRYDLLIDHDDGHFTRVQCKTGILRHGCVLFRLYSISGHDTRTKRYAGQADAFGVYCPQTRRSYLVPMTAIADCRLFGNVACRTSQERPAAAYAISGRIRDLLSGRTGYASLQKKRRIGAVNRAGGSFPDTGPFRPRKRLATDTSPARATRSMRSRSRPGAHSRAPFHARTLGTPLS